MVARSKAAARNAGISRIDQESRRTHGWFVRVYFPERTLAKFFPDLSGGGRRAALRRARQHRDDVRAAAEGLIDTGLGRRYMTRMDHDRVKGWWVRVPDGRGGRNSRLFSDALHDGDEGARIAAERWRDVLAIHAGIVATPVNA